MNALLARRMHGSSIAASDFPEGLFRVPSHVALAASESALATVGIARARLGDRPDAMATVFRHEGQLFALVDYPDEKHPSLFFEVDESLAEWRPQRASFGKRTVARRG